MNPTLLLACWGLTLLLIAVPGPDWAFVLAAGARDRVVAPAVGGLVLGYVLLTAVAAGVGTAVERAPVVLTVLTIAGGGYLSHLGVSYLRRPGTWHTADGETPRAGTHLRRGIAVSGLNPKGLLIFLTVLPQFADARGSWPVPVQLSALGLVFAATCGLFYTAVGLAARRFLAGRPGPARGVARFAGVALVVLGLALVVERVHPGGTAALGAAAITRLPQPIGGPIVDAAGPNTAT